MVEIEIDSLIEDNLYYNSDAPNDGFKLLGPRRTKNQSKFGRNFRQIISKKLGNLVRLKKKTCKTKSKSLNPTSCVRLPHPPWSN